MEPCPCCRENNCRFCTPYACKKCGACFIHCECLCGALKVVFDRLGLPFDHGLDVPDSPFADLADRPLVVEKRENSTVQGRKARTPTVAKPVISPTVRRRDMRQSRSA